MAFAPLITRLYGPEAYGLQGVFMSVVGLTGAVAALGYPTAIVLPRSDDDARGLVRLSIYVGVVTSLVALLLFAFGGDALLSMLNAQKLGGLIYLVPVAMFFGVLGSTLGQWLIRKQAFRLTARYGVLTTALLSVAKTGLGYIHPSALVLILTNVIGGLVGTALTFVGWLRQKTSLAAASSSVGTSTVSIWRVATQHRDFPLLRTPQNLINGFSQALPVLLLASFFGSAAAGQYSIALTVLAVPATLVGGSVMSVFYPRVNEALHKGENAQSLIARATLGMALTGGLPYLIVVIAGPWLFPFVFGEEWGAAGHYAQWLAPWLFLQFINKPAVAAIPALRLQGGLLIYELFSTGTKVLALWLGFSVFEDDVTAVALFSIVGIVAYVWLILWVIRKSTPSTVQVS